MKIAAIIAALALGALVIVGQYSNSKKCGAKGGTLVQGAKGPICARVEVIRT